MRARFTFFLLVIVVCIAISQQLFGAQPVFLGQQELARITLASPRPTYPPGLIRVNVVRNGLYQLHVDTRTGKVISVKTLQTMHSQRMDAAAYSALIRWRFRPGSPELINIALHWDPHALPLFYSGHITGEGR